MAYKQSLFNSFISYTYSINKFDLCQYYNFTHFSVYVYTYNYLRYNPLRMKACFSHNGFTLKLYIAGTPLNKFLRAICFKDIAYLHYTRDNFGFPTPVLPPSDHTSNSTFQDGVRYMYLFSCMH